MRQLLLVATITTKLLIRETRYKYLEEFNKTNIARETNGLKPLELCAYKDSMDKEWAEEDANCNN